MRRSELRVAARIARAAMDPYRPLLAQIVVTRRCNLSCGYCFEHDDRSDPVPTATLLERFDHFRRLRVVFVTLNGGEPLLHPEVVRLVEAIGARGMTPMMNSNGFLLTRPLVDALGDAGLFGLQISADGLRPNATTAKALTALRPKLELLRSARFRVRVNAVLGSCPPDETVAVIREATALGFDAQCSLRRDPSGAAVPFDEATQRAYDEIRAMTGRLPSALHDGFQLPLVRGDTVHWKCRSGARYFHVDEHGLVYRCQPRMDLGGKPLADYGEDDIRAAFYANKPCSLRCPHAYAHIGSRLDGFRRQESACSSP